MGCMSSTYISIIVFLLLISGVIHVSVGEPYCSKVENSGEELPFLPNSYQTVVEMNNILLNSTLEFEEWYIYADNNKGSSKLRVHMEGEMYELYFSYQTQEIFYVNPRSLSCQIFNMSNAGDLNDFFGRNVGTIIQMGNIREILRFSKDFGMKHMGIETVRGITVDHWYSCQNWTDRYAQLTVDWFWSVESWKTATDPRVPVRAEVKGIASPPGQSPHNFHFIYEFSFFRRMVSENSVTFFETPRGVYCKGRVQTKPLPKLNPIMIYEQEILISNPTVESVQFGKMFYDATQQLVRYEYREPNAQLKPPFYNYGSLSVVQDFKTGVAYFIDQALGNCTYQAIGTDFFYSKSVDLKESPGWHIAELRNPNDLFKFDKSYQYEGKRLARGLPVDVYISLRDDFVLPIIGRVNVTYEYYILDENIAEETIGKDKISIGTSVPIELRIVQYTEGGPNVDPAFNYQERYNFYNFDVDNIDDIDKSNSDGAHAYSFDIKSCYPKEQTMNIQLKFSGDVLTVKSQPTQFIRNAVDAIGNGDLGLVNPIRFQSPKLDYDDKFIYLTFTLLDAPNIYSQFIRAKGNDEFVLSVDTTVSVKSEKDCLTSCSYSYCNSAAFCENTGSSANCMLSNKLGIQKNPNSYTCSVFVRPVNSSKAQVAEVPLETAWLLIENSAILKSLNLSLENAIGVKKLYTAVDARNFSIRLDVYNPLTGRNMKKFNEIKESYVKDPSERKIDDKISADECAVSCLNELDFSCRAFTYCYDIGQCFLTRESPDNKTNLLTRARCNVYARTDLSRFREFSGISISSGIDPIIIESNELCAQKCLNTTSCRSFDYCDMPSSSTSKLCYLNSGHTTDVDKQVKNSTRCSHFSRSFVDDFIKRRTVSNPDFAPFYEYYQLSEDSCGRKCVEEFGQKCQAYYYCDQSVNQAARCVIVTTEDKFANSIDDGAPPVCVLKERIYNLDGSLYSTKSTVSPSPKSSGVSVAATVGAVFLVLLVGTFLGIILLIGIFQCRGKSLWQDIKAGFTRR